MTLRFTERVRVPADVLVSQLEGESVILNLTSESYFGLDTVGTRMWTAVTTANSIEAAFEVLREEFDVEPERLRQDLAMILETLFEHGLLEVQH